MGCLDVWGSRANQARRVPLGTPVCPSSAPEAPRASRAHEAFPGFRVPLGLTANRASPGQKGRWARQVPEDSRDLKDKKEKRVNVESTHIGST